MFVKMTEEQVDVLMNVGPSYLEHKTCKKGKKELCLMLNKALCGCV